MQRLEKVHDAQKTKHNKKTLQILLQIKQLQLIIFEVFQVDNTAIAGH